MEYDEDDFKQLDRFIGEQRHLQSRFAGNMQVCMSDKVEENKNTSHEPGKNIETKDHPEMGFKMAVV